MKVKLDENLGKSIQRKFENSNFDAHTVQFENLQGKTDEIIFEVCQREKRSLITLDIDFSDIIRFPLS